MTTADLLVVGGGPAGLTAAISARHEGLDVVVIEPRVGAMDKACGEGLMPRGVTALRALGVRPLDGWPLMQVTYLDAEDASRSAFGVFPGEGGLGVRRTELMAAMTERAREVGVRWHRQAVHSVEERRGSIAACGLSAPYLIAADGLHSTVRRLLELDLPPAAARPRFGTRRHFGLAPWSNGVEVHLAPGAEAYVTPVGRDSVGVAFLSSAPSHFSDLLPRFPVLRGRLASAPVLSRARGAGPFEQRVSRRVRGRVLLVGDAAGYVDPLTGEGVALGIHTAHAAVRCIAMGAPERHDAIYHELVRRHEMATGALLRALEHRILHRPFLRAAASAPAVFDAILAWLDEPQSAEWGSGSYHSEPRSRRRSSNTSSSASGM